MRETERRILGLLPVGAESDGLARIALRDPSEWPFRPEDGAPGAEDPVAECRAAAQRLLPGWAPGTVRRLLAEDLRTLLDAVRDLLDERRPDARQRLEDLHYEQVCRWIEGPQGEEPDIPGVLPEGGNDA